MEKHPVEKIAFVKSPVQCVVDYGGSRIGNQNYIHYFTLDGKKITGDGMDFGSFYGMLEEPGDYWPFCCRFCGLSECAGIFMPIRCFHRGDEIILVIREPLWDACSACDREEECKNPDACPDRHFRYRAHRVKKAQMRAALDELERWAPSA